VDLDALIVSPFFLSGVIFGALGAPLFLAALVALVRLKPFRVIVRGLAAALLLALGLLLDRQGAHLHMAVSDTQGRVIGGHVCKGCEIRTTAELLIAELRDYKLSREYDPTTGFKELVVRRAVECDKEG